MTGSLFIEGICCDVQSVAPPVMVSLVIDKKTIPDAPATVAVPNANYNRAVASISLKLEGLSYQ